MNDDQPIFLLEVIGALPNFIIFITSNRYRLLGPPTFYVISGLSSGPIFNIYHSYLNEVFITAYGSLRIVDR